VKAIHEGARLFVVAAGFDLETFDRGFRDLTKLLGESGEVIATVPGKPATAEQINFRLLYAAELVTGETLRQASSLGRISCNEIEIARATLSPRPRKELLRNLYGQGAIWQGRRCALK
jgi:hypothetical protein